MQKIRWGIIGCGDVTEVKSGPAFYKLEGSELIAVMRRNANLAKEFAKRHNVPKWYSDAESLVNDPEIDAIYIATPPSTHKEYTFAGKSLSGGRLCLNVIYV
ncbi:Gfo/Idh/MocA family protein [Xenorhabdus bovienii]|uniref:Gfo/Idh/MocA family protein n=1 Tax=Xenorhabdus bovienii TaxID=40576 RepID=UPI0023B300B2|nr:Gfo/Idh/MocA family oxidoreductase [Xenorhabdus bovienii]